MYINAKPSDLEGRCISCGLLAKHSKALDEYYELPQHERLGADVNIFVHIKERRSNAPQVDIVCFVRAADLEAETMIASKSCDAEAAIKILRSERNCARWYPYTQGRSPKEHLEELNMQQLEQSRRDFELKLFELSRKIQEDSKTIAHDSYKFGRRVSWAIIFFTVVQLLIATLSLAYPNGMPWLMRVLNNQAQPVEVMPQPVEPSNEPPAPDN